MRLERSEFASREASLATEGPKTPVSPGQPSSPLRTEPSTLANGAVPRDAMSKSERPLRPQAPPSSPLVVGDARKRPRTPPSDSSASVVSFAPASGDGKSGKSQRSPSNNVTAKGTPQDFSDDESSGDEDRPAEVRGLAASFLAPSGSDRRNARRATFSHVSRQGGVWQDDLVRMNQQYLELKLELENERAASSMAADSSKYRLSQEVRTLRQELRRTAKTNTETRNYAAQVC